MYSFGSVANVTHAPQARLTFNIWRRGGFKAGVEDYRWEVLRARLKNPLLLFMFNVLYICLAQSMLLMLHTAPTYVFLLLAAVPEGHTLGASDLVFTLILILMIFIEYLADQQQWEFQSAKKAYQTTASVPPEFTNTFTTDDLKRGFVVNGLWSWCRHSNFAAEQAIWLTLYLWACYDTRTYFNWSGIGVFALILLFHGSTIVTEEISAGKYPQYKEYQTRVGKFIPRPSFKPGGGWKKET